MAFRRKFTMLFLTLSKLIRDFVARVEADGGTVESSSCIKILGLELYNWDYYFRVMNAKIELVVNGDFATDSDWTKGTGWTISGGSATATASGANSWLSQTTVGSVAIGKMVAITYTVVSNTLVGNSLIQVGAYDVANDIFPNTILLKSNIVGTHTEYFEVPSTNATNPKTKIAIRLAALSTSGAISIDNVSVSEVPTVESLECVTT